MQAGPPQSTTVHTWDSLGNAQKRNVSTLKKKNGTVGRGQKRVYSERDREKERKIEVIK